MATEELVRLDIPALPAFVGVARSVVAMVATSVEGIDDDRLDDLRLAVSEACTNAVDGRAGGDNRVILRCALDDEGLEVRIDDATDGFLAEVIAERGWGLQLISALVDDVQFSSNEAGGTAVTLRMTLDA